MITLCTVCGQYHDSTACPNQHLSWHSKQGDQWKPLSQDDVMYWKIKAEQAESDLLSARQTIAEQEKRIKELEQIVNSKTMIIKSLRDQPNYDPDDFRVGKGK